MTKQPGLHLLHCTDEVQCGRQSEDTTTTTLWGINRVDPCQHQEKSYQLKKHLCSELLSIRLCAPNMASGRLDVDMRARRIMNGITYLLGLDWAKPIDTTSAISLGIRLSVRTRCSASAHFTACKTSASLRAD